MKSPLPFAAAAALCLALFAGCGGEGESPLLPPGGNVLLVTLDTVRADRLGCYGCAAAGTPALDGLAARGILFEQAFTAVPITLPSHVTMMTGLLPPEHGIRVNEDVTLDRERPTLATLFRAAGYRTAAFVGAYVLDASFGLAPGFDLYDDTMPSNPERTRSPMERERPADRVVDAALDWIGGAADRPFFCWVHLYDPHLPYAPPEPWAGRFPDDPYAGEIAFADSQVGRLLDGLEAAGLRGTTLIAVAGDHGEGLGDHDERDHAVFVYETTMRVPLLFSLPGRIGEGLRVNTTVGLVDLLPTIADCAAIPVPPGVSGRSLVPALTGAGIAPRDQYGESDYPFISYGWSPLRCVTTERWKYIRAPREELYDRRADPGETDNLADRKADSLADRKADSLADVKADSLADGKTDAIADETTGPLTEMRERLAALEKRLRPRAQRSRPATDEQRQGLEALGYTTGHPSARPPRDFSGLVDPKEMSGVLNRWLEALDLLRNDRPDGAIAILEPLAGELPDSGRLQSTLAGALARRGDGDGAIRHFRLALAAHEKSGRSDGPEIARLHNDTGGLLARSGRRTEAIGHFEAALRIWPDYLEARGNLGSALAGEGNLERAIACFRAVLESDPRNSKVRGNLGRALFIRGQNRTAEGAYEAAVALLREAAACRPGDPRIADALAIACAGLGRFEEALAAARSALVIARRAGDSELAADIESRIRLYEAKRPAVSPFEEKE